MAIKEIPFGGLKWILTLALDYREDNVAIKEIPFGGLKFPSFEVWSYVPIHVRGNKGNPLRGIEIRMSPPFLVLVFSVAIKEIPFGRLKLFRRQAGTRRALQVAIKEIPFGGLKYIFEPLDRPKPREVAIKEIPFGGLKHLQHSSFQIVNIERGNKGNPLRGIETAIRKGCRLFFYFLGWQ